MEQLEVLGSLVDVEAQALAEAQELILSPLAAQMTVEEVVKAANHHFKRLNFRSAAAIFTSFFNKFKDNGDYLYSFGYFLYECGYLDLSGQFLKRSVELEPNREFRKYFILGDLFKGTDINTSLNLFQKGLELAEKAGEEITQESIQAQSETTKAKKILSKLEDTKRTISQAFCSVAEIMMNLKEFPKNVGKIKIAIESAEKYDPSYLEPIYQKCFLFFNLGDENSCRKEIEKFVQGIKAIEEANDENLLDYPSPMLVSLVRMMIEGAIWEDGSYLAEIAVENDGTNYEALYMLAFCSFNMEDLETTKEALDKLETMDLTADQEMSEAIKELKEEYELAAPKDGEGMDVEEKGDDDEEWEDS
jgi:tetratricopeptide (TPR) repeat protein